MQRFPLKSLLCSALLSSLLLSSLPTSSLSISPLLPFPFLQARYDDVKREVDATVADEAPAGADALILALPVLLGVCRQVHLGTGSHFSQDPLPLRPRSEEDDEEEEDTAQCTVAGKDP